MIPNLVDKIMRYENGEMTDEETFAFFQELVNTGLAYNLQGSYGRTAERFIAAGFIKRPDQS